AGTVLSPLSLRMAGCTVTPAVACTGNLFPANLGPTTSYLPGVSNGVGSTNTLDSGIAKIDYHMNDKNTFTGMYFIGQLDGSVNDSGNQLQPFWQSLVHARAQVADGNWTWTPNSTWVNEFRVGYDHEFQPTTSEDSNIP